jgi:hypothetical protein
MTTEIVQLIGLVAAVALYAGAALATPSVIVLRVRRFPASWATVPVLRDAYSRKRQLEALRAELHRKHWLVGYIATMAVPSGLFAITGPSVPAELGVCAAGALYLAFSGAPRLRKQSMALAGSLGLSESSVDSALRPIYLTGLFAGSAGLLGIGCFLGGAIGALA